MIKSINIQTLKDFNCFATENPVAEIDTEHIYQNGKTVGVSGNNGTNTYKDFIDLLVESKSWMDTVVMRDVPVDIIGESINSMIYNATLEEFGIPASSGVRVKSIPQGSHPEVGPSSYFRNAVKYL